VICFELDGVGDDFESFVCPLETWTDTWFFAARSRVSSEATRSKRFAAPLFPSPPSPANLASAPTVRVDKAGGVRKAVAHLVDVHGRRRHCFLCEREKPPATDERL
jgi:hypothetical protein